MGRKFVVSLFKVRDIGFLSQVVPGVDVGLEVYMKQVYKFLFPSFIVNYCVLHHARASVKTVKMRNYKSGLARPLKEH